MLLSERLVITSLVALRQAFPCGMLGPVGLPLSAKLQYRLKTLVRQLFLSK